MKSLKNMCPDERFDAWCDHMNGFKINKELQERGIGLDKQREVIKTAESTRKNQTKNKSWLKRISILLR